MLSAIFVFRIVHEVPKSFPNRDNHTALFVRDCNKNRRGIDQKQSDEDTPTPHPLMSGQQRSSFAKNSFEDWSVPTGPEAGCPCHERRQLLSADLVATAERCRRATEPVTWGGARSISSSGRILDRYLKPDNME